MTDTDLGGNAGTGRNLEEVRAAAQVRATALQETILLFEHVGGFRPGLGMVPANGSYLWRDSVDQEGRALATPKFVWRLLETVQPNGHRLTQAIEAVQNAPAANVPGVLTFPLLTLQEIEADLRKEATAAPPALAQRLRALADRLAGLTNT